MPLRVALLGAGAIGSIVAGRVYADPPAGVELVAVVDRDRERAEAAPAPPGVPALTSLSEALRLGVDAVDVRLPHAAHRDAALEALDAGLHVLVEKPLAADLPGARDIARAASASDRTVAVTENYPHMRSVRAVRRAIDEGAIGEVLTMRTTRAYALGGVWDVGWRRGGEAQSGVLWDQGTHHASLLRALGGDIRSVSAERSAGWVSAGVESVALTLRFATGTVAQSTYTWGTPSIGVETEALVLGTTGRLHVDVDYDGSTGAAVRVGVGGVERLSQPECYYDSHRWIVEDWAAAIRDGRPPLVGVDEALHDVRVVAAALESIERGGAVVDVEGLG